jgi:hypothetical protein
MYSTMLMELRVMYTVLCTLFSPELQDVDSFDTIIHCAYPLALKLQLVPGTRIKKTRKSASLLLYI